MDALPTGTVTFLFTDIEGSTRLLAELGTDALAEQRFHDQLVPEVRERLGEDGLERELNAGRQLSFEEALGLALRRG